MLSLYCDVYLICAKDFRIVFFGYDPLEIDKFLDGVIHDYFFFKEELERMRKENDSLRKMIRSLYSVNTEYFLVETIWNN